MPLRCRKTILTLALLATVATHTHAQVSLETDGRLREAMALVQTQNWPKALEVYQGLINEPDPIFRAQSRYGLAVVLAQLGREAEALKALEGTSADDTELGEAVGNLRGHLVLQLAERGLMERGNGEPYLTDYNRLTHRPDPLRAQRLRAMADTTLTGATLKVGVILPLSGPLAPVGQGVLQGLQLAMGTQPASFELTIADTTPNPQDALDEVLAQGARVVVGPLLATHVRDLARRAQAAGVPMLVFSNDDEVLGQGAHGVVPLPSAQAARVAQWALAQGHTRLGALIPSTPYGNIALDALRTEVERGGGSVVKTSFVNPMAVDLGASIRQLAGGQAISSSEPPFKALFMPIPPAMVPLATSQLAFYDFDQAGLQLLGTGLWQDPALLLPANRAIRGGVFAAQGRGTGFDAAYTDAFGTPPTDLAVVGFDVGHVLAQLAATHLSTRASLEEHLTQTHGFYAPGGFMRFHPHGRTERGLAVVRIGEGAFHVLQPALVLPPLPVPTNLRPTVQKRWRGWW